MNETDRLDGMNFQVRTQISNASDSPRFYIKVIFPLPQGGSKTYMDMCRVEEAYYFVPQAIRFIMLKERRRRYNEQSQRRDQTRVDPRSVGQGQTR